MSKGLLAVIPKSVPAARKALAAMEADIESAETYDTIRSIERAADAIKLLFSQVEEVRVEAEKIVVLANHRIGAELADAPTARGGRPKKTSPDEGPVIASLKERVGSKNRGLALKKLGSIKRDDIKQAITALHEQGKEATVAAVLKHIKGDDKAQRRAERERELANKVVALPEKKYVVIVADPEWRFEPWSRVTGMDRAADNHYPTSCTELIAARDVPSIAADDCVLFLWATIPMLRHAFVVMEGWGFDYVSHYAWGKDRIGTGYWSREKHELLLIGTRGNVPAPAPGTQFDSLIEAARGEHSQKPEIFLQMIEQYFPHAPKIELNRRGPARPGWDAWGNEVEQEGEAAA